MQEKDCGNNDSADDLTVPWTASKSIPNGSLQGSDHEARIATDFASTSTTQPSLPDQSDGVSVYQRIKAQLLQQRFLKVRAEEDKENYGKETDSTAAVIELSQHDDFERENETSGDEDIRPHGRFARKMMAASTNADIQTPELENSLGISNDDGDSVADTASDAPDDDDLSTLNMNQIHRDSKPQPEQDKLKLLIEKKRKERLQREEAEKQLSIELGGDAQLDDLFMDESDSERMASTIPSRAPRTASKNARDEISRETARMARNMQLQHEPRVAKKFEKASLLDKFNFKKPASAAVQSPAESDISGVFDVAVEGKVSSPATSPPQDLKAAGSLDPIANPFSFEIDDAEEAIENAQNQGQEQAEDKLKSHHLVGSLFKGKGKAKTHKGMENGFINNVPAVRVRRVNPVEANDSDSDLEIAKEGSHTKQPPINESFRPHRIVASRPSYTPIASIGQSNIKQMLPKRMTKKDLDLLLKTKSRLQIAKEREEREKELREKGAFLPTMEERANEIVEVENLVDKARKEAEEIRQKEKQAASKTNGDVYHESSDDESWNGDEELDKSDDTDAIVSNDDIKPNSMSGDSEDEDNSISMQFPTNEREQSLENAESQIAVDLSNEEDVEQSAEMPMYGHHSRTRRANVIYDDDELDTEKQQDLSASLVEVQQTPASPEIQSHHQIDMGISPSYLGGMTQIFESTLPAKHSSPKSQDAESKLARLRNPYGELPFISPGNVVRDKGDALLAEPASIPADPYSLSIDETPHDPYTNPFYSANIGATQQSELAEPVFDFSVHRLPTSPNVADPIKTGVEPTVDQNVDDSDVQVKKSKLFRRLIDNHIEKENVPNAFEILKAKPRKRPEINLANAGNQRKAQELVEEQAEESDDEYAGLGGRSDEDNEDTGSDLEDLIDHSKIKVRERELATFHAEQSKQRDETDINRLMNDITNGTLRKRGGVDYLSDDDEENSAREIRDARRRAMRLKLLEDQKLSNLNNPRQIAFLQSVEDREDMIPIFDAVVDEKTDSQTNDNTDFVPQSQITEITESQDDLLVDDEGNEQENSTSRPEAVSKESTFQHVRKELAFLAEDSQSGIDFLSDEDESNTDSVTGESQEERLSRLGLVDRVTMKRAAATPSENARVAFARSDNFAIPELPRRMSMMSNSSSESSINPNTNADRIAIRKSTNRSRSGATMSVNYQPRVLKSTELQQASSKKGLKEQRRKHVSAIFGTGTFV